MVFERPLRLRRELEVGLEQLGPDVRLKLEPRLVRVQVDWAETLDLDWRFRPQVYPSQLSLQLPLHLDS